MAQALQIIFSTMEVWDYRLCPTQRFQMYALTWLGPVLWKRSCDLMASADGSRNKGEE